MLTATRDAIVTLLNSSAFTPQVSAHAAYEEIADLETFAPGSVRLLVIPRGGTADLLTYDEIDTQALERKPTVDVVLQYHPKTLAPAELDPYLSLAEAIAAKLLGAKITDASSRIVEVQWLDGTWDIEHLRKYGVFTVPLACVLEQIST